MPQSVGINTEQPDTIKLRQFWYENSQQGEGVDDKVVLIVPGVETCQKKPL